MKQLIVVSMLTSQAALSVVTAAPVPPPLAPPHEAASPTSVPADTASQALSLSAHLPLTLNDDVIHQAIKDALGTTPTPDMLPRQSIDGFSAGRDEIILARAFNEAKIPDCLHADAMKFVPPKIGPVDLAQAFATPFWAYAVVSGKCH